eukprot:6421855-Amphidinium_carterae.1
MRLGICSRVQSHEPTVSPDAGQRPRDVRTHTHTSFHCSAVSKAPVRDAPQRNLQPDHTLE